VRFALSVVGEEDITQAECIFEGYSQHLLDHGQREGYDLVFPESDGAFSISMRTARIGLSTFYLYTNASSDDELVEHLTLELQNQAFVQYDASDEYLLSKPDSIIPQSQSRMEFEFSLAPGQVKLFAHRPCSSLGASSSISRSCSLLSNISSERFMQLTRERGEKFTGYGTDEIHQFSLQHGAMFGILLANESEALVISEELEFELTNYEIVGHPGQSVISITVIPGSSHCALYFGLLTTMQGRQASWFCSQSIRVRGIP
jgi:hypothetical protein